MYNGWSPLSESIMHEPAQQSYSIQIASEIHMRFHELAAVNTAHFMPTYRRQAPRSQSHWAQSAEPIDVSDGIVPFAPQVQHL